MSIGPKLTTAALCFVLTGCSVVKPPPHDRRSFAQRLPLIGEPAPPSPEEPYPFPTKIAATWTPDTLVQTGRTPTRGFGGRVFFYDEKSRVVPVEGTLVIHGYDDTDGKDPSKSTKRFEFTPEQLTRHFGQTDLGASYSVWIPWDALGGEQRRISLVASFRTDDGHLVQGVPAVVMLPGPGSHSGETELSVKRMSPNFKEHQNAVAKAMKSQAPTHNIADSNRIDTIARQVAVRNKRRVGELARSPEPSPARMAELRQMTESNVAEVTPKQSRIDSKVRTASHRLGNLPERR